MPLLDARSPRRRAKRRRQCVLLCLPFVLTGGVALPVRHVDGSSTTSSITRRALQRGHGETNEEERDVEKDSSWGFGGGRKPKGQMDSDREFGVDDDDFAEPGSGSTSSYASSYGSHGSSGYGNGDKGATTSSYGSLTSGYGHGEGSSSYGSSYGSSTSSGSSSYGGSSYGSSPSYGSSHSSYGGSSSSSSSRYGSYGSSYSSNTGSRNKWWKVQIPLLPVILLAIVFFPAAVTYTAFAFENHPQGKYARSLRSCMNCCKTAYRLIYNLYHCRFGDVADVICAIDDEGEYGKSYTDDELQSMKARPGLDRALEMEHNKAVRKIRTVELAGMTKKGGIV